MTEINCDIDGVIKQLQKINPNKANGPDKVQARFIKETAMECGAMFHVVVVVDPTPPTCCQQSPAPESCGSQQSLPPGGKERLHFVGIRPEVQARKGGW